MFACFGWSDGQIAPETIWFFPLIPVANIEKRVLSERHKTPGRRMAEYVRMRDLPHLVVFSEGGAPGHPSTRCD